MGLLTSNEQGRPFLLNHSIYSKHRHPPLLSRSQETLEVCLSQGSSYESHTGGLDSRRLCGPGGYLSWTRCDKRSLRPSYRVAVSQRRRQRAHRSRRRNYHLVAVGQRIRRPPALVLRTLRKPRTTVRNTLAHAQDGYCRRTARGDPRSGRSGHRADHRDAGRRGRAARGQQDRDRSTRRRARV